MPVSRAICRAVDAEGRPGHPVLFGRRFFENLSRLSGDEGARDILRANEDFVTDVPTPGRAARLDSALLTVNANASLDTPLCTNRSAVGPTRFPVTSQSIRRGCGR